MPQSSAPQPQKRQFLSLKTNVFAVALSTSVLPVLIVGILTYLPLRLQIEQAKQADATELTEAEIFVEQRLPVWIGTTAVLAGTIAVVLAKLVLRPVLESAITANSVVNRLRRDDDRVRRQDALTALQDNIQFIDEQLPKLLSAQETEAERTHLIFNLTRHLRQSLSEEDVLRTAVAEIRGIFRADRVAIFRFDTADTGTIIEESVAPGWPKMLWATLTDPCLHDYVEQYQNGRVRAISDIYNAGLNECHIGLLERFAVKANLIAPIVVNSQLFGLLITNQCSAPRLWQAIDCNLITQVSTQVGLALDQVRLLEQADAKASQAQIFIDITRRIRASLNEDDILNTTVEEIRKTLGCDRVIVYGFDPEWYGTVIAESVVRGFPKAMGANIKDPCFAEGYVEQYQSGRVNAISNIDEAGLTDCYRQQLEPFAVKANLVAPILMDHQLLGLLIAHQCSGPRYWQPSEIGLFAQLATQVGFALDQARLLAQVDARAQQAQILNEVTRQIRDSLDEDTILKVTVEQVRKVLRADRTVIYNFNSTWGGSIVAESVLPGWPHALAYKIEDACIPESIRRAYVAGRVVPTANVFEAGFHPDHVQLMRRLQIQANLVAPILHQGHLFGLLIAHQCSGTRTWQPSEIDWLTQIATQVGFALDHARVLEQVELAYQTAESTSNLERRHQASLQQTILTTLQDSDRTLKSSSLSLQNQVQSIMSAGEQIQAIADGFHDLVASLQHLDQQGLQVDRSLQNGRNEMHQILESLLRLRQTVLAITPKLQLLLSSVQQMSDVLIQMGNTTAQIKLKAMNTALEASRMGTSGQKFADLGNRVFELTRQLDDRIVEFKPLVATVRSEADAIATAIAPSTQQVNDSGELVGHIQQQLSQMATDLDQMRGLLNTITVSTTHHAQASTLASQSILDVANLIHQAAERSSSLSRTFDSLIAIVQKPH
jgi:methyl-accepting chemotaxis protein PixJ